MVNTVDTDHDPVFEALTNLTEAAASGAKNLQALEEDLQEMRSRRKRGFSWRHIVATRGSTNALSAATTIAANLGRASGILRRAVARALRGEGMQVTEIAELFEVSRQRVSALVRTPIAKRTQVSDQQVTSPSQEAPPE